MSPAQGSAVPAGAQGGPGEAPPPAAGDDGLGAAAAAVPVAARGGGAALPKPLAGPSPLLLPLRLLGVPCWAAAWLGRCAALPLPCSTRLAALLGCVAAAALLPLPCAAAVPLLSCCVLSADARVGPAGTRSAARSECVLVCCSYWFAAALSTRVPWFAAALSARVPWFAAAGCEAVVPAPAGSLGRPCPRNPAGP